MDQNPNFLSKSDEKCRRYQVKALYCKLCSLLPNQSSKGVVSLSDQLEEATNYIKMLQEKLEAIKEKKNLLRKRKSAEFGSSILSGGDAAAGGEVKLPRIEVHASASALDVVLITGFEHQYMFKETVRILHEEGADVACASFSVVDHTVFHTLYCEIAGRRLKNEATRIFERLRNSVAVNK